MIDQNCFSVASEHIFLNVSSCEAALLCIPVTSDKDINPEVAALFKKIMFSTQFDNSEDATYITQLITYINSGASFTVYGLKDLVAKLQSGVSIGVQMPPVQQAPAMQQPVNIPPAQQVPAATEPASPFDSTISIDEMPAMMAQKQAQQAQAPTQNPQVHIPNEIASRMIVRGEGAWKDYLSFAARIHKYSFDNALLVYPPYRNTRQYSYKLCKGNSY